MKVTYSWLKDFVEIKISPPALAEKLTMAGLEVTALERQDNDFVFEIEITSNRPDCLSVIGVAREVAAITGKRLKLPQTASHKLPAKNPQPCVIRIEDKKDCPLYTAKIIRQVKVGPSPEWLKKRLALMGCRSVNSIVDITNYILFAWGQPLHAFDLDKLTEGTIIVRRAKENEQILTIDGEIRKLNKNILLIADRNSPIGIAGIMGGKNTEVSEKTKNILLEAAVFNPIIIRRARQALGLITESAYRFERGVDSKMLESAAWQAVELIQGATSGKCVLAKSSGLPKREKKKISLDVSYVHKILGVNIASSKIKGILNNLGFKVKAKTKNNLSVEIPSYRPDISLEIDLIEEVARIFGYAHIPKTLPSLIPQITPIDTRGLVSLIKNTLVGLGLNETITYSLVDRDLLKEFPVKQDSSVIEILNPLSKEQEVLRPALAPSLARCVAYNLNQKQDYINIFEIAKVFSGASPQSQEELFLGIALCGTKSCFVFEQGLVKETLGMLHLKGTLEALFERLGIKDYNFAAIANAEVAVYIQKETIGVIARLEKNILDQLDIKNKEVWATELSLKRIFSYADLKKRFARLPVYPGISRDISFILKEGILLEDILQAIREQARPLLKKVKLIDYYQGKQIPSGFKGLTVSCFYRSDERTLTEDEINPIHALVAGILVERFQAQIR